jgi:predicted nucleic acid-binding protein
LIVVDASAILELLLQTPKAARLETLALDPDEQLHAPHLIDVEVTRTLRRLVLAKEMSVRRAEQALDDYSLFVIERHDHRDLVRRAWELRDAVTAYDGVYLALAEALASTLITCDAKLARANGHRAKITLV